MPTWATWPRPPTRLLSSSAADLLEDRFESDALKGVLSVSAVIGSWAGPRTPGTAYVIAHHYIGDLGDGRIGAWGFPRGGMGGITQALAAAARWDIRAVHVREPDVPEPGSADLEGLELSAIDGADHFTVLQGLEDAHSPVCRWLHQKLTA